MEKLAVTHSGKFHADDVLAWALIQTFHPEKLTLRRVRAPFPFHEAHVVFDIGGIFDPKTARFDHHQIEYSGPLSSAGMVLHWLNQEGHITNDLTAALQTKLVEYVDDVDNGRVQPKSGIPCFANMIDLFNRGCRNLSDFDDAFHKAATLAKAIVIGVVSDFNDAQAAKETVILAMNTAKENGTNIIFFEHHVPWQQTYFANGGDQHPTDFVVFPSLHNTWQALGIPPEEGSFAQKRPFPESWAGLRDDALSEVTGVPGCIFCHKNKFIAVFQTKEGCLEAMRRFSLTQTST